MNYSVVDIEADGLLEEATKIHCMSVHQYHDGKERVFSLTDYDEMRAYLATERVIVGHNIIRYDIPLVKKILGIKVDARLVDTLALSWYLYPMRIKHGLEEWGEDVGVAKPKIVDWVNSTIEEYIFRCESDVEINVRVFDLQLEYLFEIYKTSDAVNRFINYLMFKMDCALEQEEVKWKLDVELCKKNLAFLTAEVDKKLPVLASVMPSVTKYAEKKRPKVVYKKDGTPSEHGKKWLELLESKGLPDYHLGTIRVPVKEEAANPRSFAQLKKWLFDMGWIPRNFNYVKQEDGSIKKIPQLSNEEKSGICDSIKEMYPICPQLAVLDGLFILYHRIGILEGFLKHKDKDDFLKAEIKGFTNTLRFQHTVIVNLPTIPKPYWEKVRGCLIAPSEDHVLCGSDMSGLEDNTKRHYMYYFDPGYVQEMMTYRFDAHCDIAVLSGKMSRDEATFFRWFDTKKEKGDHQRVLDEYYAKNFSVHEMMANNVTGLTLEELLAALPEEQDKYVKILKAVRLKSKKVNFAGVYGAGPPKIALTASITLAEAKTLHTTYWTRNWSVKKVAATAVVRTINSQMWLFNPVSQFWYSLRVEKDKFSTLNQSTGVYCFDTWVRNVRKQGVKLCGQFHDEIIAPILKTEKEALAAKLDKAIRLANEELRLNVTLSISKDFGNSYAEIH